MTWVVGANSLFGHAFLVSDIRVTFTQADDQHTFQDCLQKVYAYIHCQVDERESGRLISIKFHDGESFFDLNKVNLLMLKLKIIIRRN